MLTIEVETRRAIQAVDLTERLDARSWPDGFLVVSLQHTTAALFLGESGPEMFADYERAAEGLVGGLGPFQHERWNPGNAQAHIMSSFIGTQLLLPVADGRLALGTWQRVILLELDGPRRRNIVVGSIVARAIGG